MKRNPFLFTAIAFFAYLGILAAQNVTHEETIEEKAARIHRSAIICDTHADSFTVVQTKDANFLQGSKLLQIDLPKLKAGNVALSSQAIWVLNKGLKTTPLAYVTDTLKTFEAVMDVGSYAIRQVRGYSDFVQARKDGKIAILLTIEDGRAIEGKIENLKMLYDRGVRGMSLTWNINNKLASSAWGARHRKGQGLTPLGREVVREMASMGMMIDVSHASTQTFKDVLETIDVPVYASHSCARQLNNHWRNLWDYQIKAIAERGGVIGVNFYSTHLRKDNRQITAKDVARHIDYIVKIGGIDVVAIGTDYDGDIGEPKGLENISKLEALTEELVRRGYSEEDIRKILGLNFLRFFQKICP